MLKVRQETETEFRRLEEALGETNPGVLDLLRVYGDYEAAARQADAYFRLMTPAPRISTSNTSG